MTNQSVDWIICGENIEQLMVKMAVEIVHITTAPGQLAIISQF